MKLPQLLSCDTHCFHQLLKQFGKVVGVFLALPLRFMVVLLPAWGLSILICIRKA